MKSMLNYNFPMKKCSHVLLPVLAPEPEKVNPLGLAGGKEETLFQKELSERNGCYAGDCTSCGGDGLASTN